MQTATEQEQEVLTDRLLVLSWAEAIRLKYGDVTTFQPNKPQVQQAVEYPCIPLRVYEHVGEEDSVEDAMTEDKMILLAVYARWKMYPGKTARLMCVPTCKTSENETMETTVETGSGPAVRAVTCQRH